MSYNIPTTEELYQAHLARLESALGQNAPDNDKSFLKVLAKTESAQDIGLYKYAADRAKQNLALTATGEDLDKISDIFYEITNDTKIDVGFEKSHTDLPKSRVDVLCAQTPPPF